MDAQTEQALDHLIKNTASTAEIELLRQKLSAGQISIRGDVNQSVIILGDGNTVVQLTPEMVDVLTRRKLAASVPLRNPIVEGINLLAYDYDQRIQNFLTEYLGNDAHPVPFGGRDDALHMLDAWLAKTTPYLLLAAPAGRGKSALLVRWLDNLKSHEDLALAFIPVSIRFGTNMERVFYAALAARLAFLHGDDVPASPETSTAVYRGLVSDYLSKPLANGRTLLVVMDGLDEAADWQAGADFMPSELPLGVRVVVSARFLAGDADSTAWLRRLNWERSGLASAPSLAPLDRAGVADVLLKMGCPLDELSRDVDIVAELYRLSEGDPLLVSLYVGDLWAKGAEVTRLKPKDLAGIQPGYKGYFDCWWKDQRKLWKDKKPWLEKHVRLVRNLLAGALGVLFLVDIHSLDPELESDYIADALDVLQRFVIGDNQTQGYTFSHPKLGQYFWEALTEAEQAQVERRFLVWGERTLREFIAGNRNPKKKIEVPAYVVRNYGAHLARAQQPIEKWLPLIQHQQWAQAWFTLEGAYGGYLQDVRRVWDQCKLLDQQAVERTDKAPYLDKQIRCALIETSLHSLAGNIPPELILPLVQNGSWTWPQVFVTIRQMPDPEKQVIAIMDILDVIPEDQLSNGLQMARTIRDVGARSRVLSELARRLPDATREALKSVEEIQNEKYRARVLNDLIPRLPEEKLGLVLDVVRAIQNNGARARILTNLARRLPEVNGEALAAMASLGDSTHFQTLEWELHESDSMFESLRRRFAMTTVIRDGKLGQVLDAARMIQDKGAHANILSALTKHLPEAIDEALAAIDAIGDEDECANVLSALARYLPNNKLEKVLAVAQAIENEWVFVGVLNDLVERLSKWQLEQILAAVQAISDEGARSNVLVALVEYLPEYQLQQVLIATREIQDAVSRSFVLSVLVKRLPEVSREALASVRTISDEWSRACALGTLAKHLPEVASEALAVTQTISNEGVRARALNTLAQRLPEVELGHVLDAVRTIRDKRNRISVLSTIGQRLPEVNREVLTEVDALSDKDVPAYELSALAQRLPEDDLAQVLAAARSIQDKGARARVLSELAQRLPEVAGEALAAARSIQDEGAHARVLSELAQRLPEVAGEALVAAQATHNEKDHARVLSNLVQPLMKIGKKECYVWVETALGQLSLRTRADLFWDISVLLPVLLYLGAENLDREILSAVRDVTAWWP